MGLPRGQYSASLVQLTHQWAGWRDRVYPLRVCWGHQTGRSGWYTGRLSCHPVRPGQAGELGAEEPDEVQQRQVQGPAPGRNNPMHQYRLRADLLGSSSAETDLVDDPTWVSWWMTSWPWSSSVPWLPRRLMGSWGALRGVWPARRRRFPFPFTLP